MNANTYEQTYNAVVAEFGKQTKAKIYEWIDVNNIVVKDRKNKTKEDLYKVIATFKMQAPAVCEAPAMCALELLAVQTGQNYSDLYREWKSDAPIVQEEEDKSDEDDEEDSEEGSTTNEENSDEEEESEYMRELIECFKCECIVKRIDMAWRDYGYLDVCDKCDKESDDDVPVAQLIQRKVAENKQTVADLLLEKKKKQEELKQINRAISDLKRTPKKRAEEKMVPLRPTYNLAEKKPTKQGGKKQDYILFRHNKPVKGWCKYALYNSKNNNYMECNFDGKKVTDWANGKIHKTLNAWTTSNLLEQCDRENKPRKTVKNNAYKETHFIYMNLDEKKMIYTSVQKTDALNPDIMWLKSIILIDKQSELAVDWTYEKVGKKTKAKMVYVENK